MPTAHPTNVTVEADEEDVFALDLRITVDLDADAEVPCGTNDGCAATCASSCVSNM